MGHVLRTGSCQHRAVQYTDNQDGHWALLKHRVDFSLLVSSPYKAQLTYTDQIDTYFAGHRTASVSPAYLAVGKPSWDTAHSHRTFVEDGIPEFHFYSAQF